MRYRKELLPNGLLSVYDVCCQWWLVFEKDKRGKWKPYNGHAHAIGYKSLLAELNAES